MAQSPFDGVGHTAQGPVKSRVNAPQRRVTQLSSMVINFVAGWHACRLTIGDSRHSLRFHTAQTTAAAPLVA
jgi:hypothetical protein